MWFKDAENFKKYCGYEINGVWYPRVTKIIDIKSKPALEFFYKDMENFSAARQVSSKSAQEGSLVHEVVQKLAVGEKTDIPPEIKSAVEAFQEMQEEKNIVFYPEFIEKRVWSAENRYAGTLDALATIDGKFGVLDIKTSAGFYPEYNLQTAAYLQALREEEVKSDLALPEEVQTRWILRVNQHRVCKKCGAKLREKGGRSKVTLAKNNGIKPCKDEEHDWSPVIGDVELKEFPYYARDIKAFLAAKILWEWENDYWLRQIGYSR